MLSPQLAPRQRQTSTPILANRAAASRVVQSDLDHAPRGIGNQAALRLLRQGAAEREAKPAAHGLAVAPRLSRSALVLQRDAKATEAKEKARAKVTAAMDKLKAKYGLGDVSEEDGAVWSEVELARVDGAFSKMSKDEKEALKGLSLVRADKLSLMHNGKKVALSGMTSGGGSRMELSAAGAADGHTPLHEAGHVIQAKVLAAADARLHNSKAWVAQTVARDGFVAAARKASVFVGAPEEVESVNIFNKAITEVTTAADSLAQSSKDDRQARRSALQAAIEAADAASMALPANAAQAKPWQDLQDRQKQWIDTVLAWTAEKEKALGPRENLAEFVDIVTKNHLAHRGFAPFTSYVQSFWPDKPEEFFAESYAVWRDNPDYMRTHASALYDWFAKGGHLLPKTPAETLGGVMQQKAPVLNELVNEVGATFVAPVLSTIKGN